MLLRAQTEIKINGLRYLKEVSIFVIFIFSRFSINPFVSDVNFYFLCGRLHDIRDSQGLIPCTEKMREHVLPVSISIIPFPEPKRSGTGTFILHYSRSPGSRNLNFIPTTGKIWNRCESRKELNRNHRPKNL